MPTLKEFPNLATIQQYVLDLEHERGFSNENVFQKCLLLGEEVGELFKAIRKHQGMVTDDKSTYTSVSEELADVLIILCSVANRLNVDLENAFRSKEETNSNRVWKSAATEKKQ